MNDDFNQTVNRYYQDALSEFGPEGAQLRDVMNIVRPRIRALVDSGQLEIDVDGAIDAELLTVDVANGKQADRVLGRLSNGYDALALVDDPMLDVVVTLGRGLRKQWRDVTANDLRLMDDLRFDNVRKQQDAYSSWRAAFSPVVAVLAGFATIGDAVAAGAFTAPERRTA